MAKGLPKHIAKKYGISKKAWRIYRGSKSRVRRTTSKRSRPSPKRRRTVARKKRKGKSRSSNPMIGFATFALGAALGTYIQQRHVSPWLVRKTGGAGMGYGAGMLAGAFLVRRFTNKRGIKNLGLGMSAAMASAGGLALYTSLKKR